MSRFSPTEHQYRSHAEGDGAHHNREDFHEVGAREIRDDSLRLSCQTKALRSETARNHRAHCGDNLDHVQMEPDHSLCQGDLSNRETRSTRESRHNDDDDDSKCWSLSSMLRTRESQGDGFTCDSRRVANTRDQVTTDCHVKKLKTHANVDDSLRRQRKHSQSSETGTFPQSRNERDPKSSCKRHLDGFDVSTSSKGKTYSNPKHNDFEETESIVPRKKNGKSHSNLNTDRTLCPAKAEANFGGLPIQGNELRFHSEEGVCGELISDKSTSLQESHDTNVRIPDTGPGISRLKIYSHETVDLSQPDKNSAKSDSCPSDCSVSEIHLMSQADTYRVTTQPRKYHDMVAASSKRATDVLVNSNNTSHSSHARMNQAEHNLYSDTKHRSELNILKEKIENIVEKAANRSQGARPTYESRLTDHSKCTDASLPTVAAAVTRKMQQIPEGGAGEPPITKLPVRDAENEELHTAAASADDLKVIYTVPYDSTQQYSHTNGNQWTFDYEWFPGECIPETKALEATAHKEQNLCVDTQSYFRGEDTSVIGRKRTQPPTKSPRKGHNFEAKDCVQLGKAADITADRKSHSQESVQFDESDTETLDSKSRRLLNQLQMVQICKRKANVLLKHVQSIIDGSHLPKAKTNVSKSKGPRESSTNPEEPENKVTPSSFKFRHKPRPKSESPDRLRRKLYGKAPVARAGVDSLVATTSDKLPVQTLTAGVQSSNPNAGFITQETSVQPWTDYTNEMKDIKTERMLGRSEFPPNYQGEEMYEYYKSKSPDTFICETTKHQTVSDRHTIKHRQLPVKGEKNLGATNESELKSGQRCYEDNKPTEPKNLQARGANSRRESPDKRHPTSEYTQWMSATAMQGSVSPTIYYDNVSNTSESVDSVSVYDEVGSARYQNSKNFFAKDDKYYLLMRKRGTDTFTRSRSATAYTSRRQSGLHYNPKMSTKDRRHEVSRSSMRQSLKEAIKSAKQSISAAAKVAEALSFVVKASTDSSTSLSSEVAGKCPVWKHRHHSKSPAPKGDLVDDLNLSETAGYAAPPLPFNGVSVWPDEEEPLHAGSFQENIEQVTHRHHQKRLSSSLPKRLKAVNREAKSSAAIFSMNDHMIFYHQHFNSGQSLRDTENNPHGTPHAVSQGQAMLPDSSPHTWDGAGGVTKYFTSEGPRVNDGPVPQQVAEDSTALSPTITVQITISKSPDLSPKPNMNYLIDKPLHRKENLKQDTCRLFGHKSFSSQKPLSEFEQSSELTLSKENWTASHSCSSSTRKTNDYVNEVNPIEYRLLHDYGSSTRRASRRQTRAFVDGSANNVISDSAKHNANVNRSPVGKSSMQDLTQNAEQIKMGEKSQALSTTNPRLSLNGNRITAEQHHISIDGESDGSEVILTHDQNCPMNSIHCPSKRPKHSKADLCLSRSFKRSNRALFRGKVNSRNRSLSTDFKEKAGRAGEYQYLYDAKGKSHEIGIPVCYSDPSSPCVFNCKFQGMSTSYSGELRTLRETCSHIRSGKSRRCSSINREYSMQEMSPRGAFFPSHYRPELPATVGSRKSFLEYQSKHSQTTVFMETEPTYLVHTRKIKALQIPQTSAFTFSGTNSSSIEYAAICDKVLPAGDSKEAPPSWDKLPNNQINNTGKSNNQNNNNNIFVGKDAVDDKMADQVSGTREDPVIDPVTTDKMVAVSRMGRVLGVVLPVSISLRRDCDDQRRPVLTTLEILTSGSMYNNQVKCIWALYISLAYLQHQSRTIHNYQFIKLLY